MSPLTQGLNYRSACDTFFVVDTSTTRLQVRPIDKFSREIAQMTWSHARMCLLGLENPFKRLETPLKGENLAKTDFFCPKIAL